MQTVGVVVIIKCLLNWGMFQVSLEDRKVGRKVTRSVFCPAKIRLLLKALGLRVALGWHPDVITYLAGVLRTPRLYLNRNYSDICKSNVVFWIWFWFFCKWYKYFAKIFTPTSGFLTLAPPCKPIRTAPMVSLPPCCYTPEATQTLTEFEALETL